jgi:hypothetical protein
MSAKDYIEVQVLGSNDILDMPKKFFTEALKDASLKSTFIDTPAPFAAPCVDGMLILFNVSGPMAIHGFAGCLSEERLRLFPTLKKVWDDAKKPMTMQKALVHFGFQPSS